ncbi:MAG TPA: hypothetical protein VF614_02165 [Chthoniobacteraceae bacterium]|jgi:hypothetical protein
MPEPISIVSFNERPPAEKLAARLREAGFEAEVYDESLAQTWQLFQIDPHAHMRVRVIEDQSQDALRMLQEWDAADGSLAGAVRCPECQSTRVEYPQFSRRTLLGALPAIAASAGIIEKDYYCEACQYTWPAELEKAEPERDELGWEKK